MQKSNINWQAIEADPRFAKLHREKTRFLSFMMLFALVFFFCLPVATAYFQPLLTIKIWGVINIALLFALAQFVVAWSIAFIYAKRANASFDAQAQALIQEIQATTQLNKGDV